MPYTAINELPDSVKHVLPTHAQEIYKEAFNSAYEEYASAEDRQGDADQEETAHKVAWSAVRRGGYHKSEDSTWRKE